MVVVFFTVERFFDASVVFLAFFVAFAVFKEDSFFVFFPVVAVVGVEVSLVKTEFREQYRVPGELVEVVEQGHCSVVDHEEHVEVVGFVVQLDCARLFRSEVILSFFKGVPHEGVAVGGPVVRGGRSHSPVGPAVLVFDGYVFAFVGESSVLYPTAVEVFFRVFFEGDDGFVFRKLYGLCFFYNCFAGGKVDNFELRCFFVDQDFDFPGGDGDVVSFFTEFHFAHGLAGLLYEDFCFGLCFRIAENASVVVLEKAEDVVAVEVESHCLISGEVDFDCGGVDFFSPDDVWRLLGGFSGCRCLLCYL